MPYPQNADYYDRPQEEFPAATFQRDASNVRVKSLSLIATGTYNQQYARPYATDYNTDNKNDLYETLNQSYFNYQQQLRTGAAQHYVITPEMLAGSTSSFIKPSATHEAEVRVAHGWGEQRARFMMEVTVQRSGVGEQAYLIMGYTDHYGISHGQHIDPRMEFTINSIFEMGKQHVMTNMGMQEQTVLINASQLLSNETWAGDINSNAQFRMRPEDVMARISVSHIPELSRGNIEVVDARTRNTTIPVKSAYGHANPTNYLATILGGITTGQHTAALQNRHGSVYDLAAAAVADGNTQRDPFLRAMAGVRQTSMSSKFTWKDLVELDPNSDNMTTIVQRDSVQMAGAVNRPGENLHQAGSTMPWHGSDRPTQVATQIANALPHLMMDLMISSVTLHSTNRVLGMVPTTITSHLVGVVKNVNMTQYGESLKQQFITHLLNEITFNNQIGYEMTISASIMGEIWISMHLDGFDPVDYVAPAFANSLSSPVTTRNAGNLQQLALNFDELQREVFQAPFPSAQENVVWTPSGTRY